MLAKIIGCAVCFLSLTAISFSAPVDRPVEVNFIGKASGTLITDQYPDVKFSSVLGNGNRVFVGSGMFGGVFFDIGVFGADKTTLTFPNPVNNLFITLSSRSLIKTDTVIVTSDNGPEVRTTFVAAAADRSSVVDLSSFKNITQIVYESTDRIIVSKLQFTVSDPDPPDLALLNFWWDTATNDIVARYTVTGRLRNVTALDVYWASGPSFAERTSASSIYREVLQPIDLTNTSKNYALKVPGSIVSSPPPGSKFLIIVADSTNSIIESNENNNLAHLRLPTIIVSPSSEAKPDGRGRMWIEPTLPLQMPKVTFELYRLPPGIPDDVQVYWSVRLYLDADSSPDSQPVELAYFRSIGGKTYTPVFDQLSGGKLEVSARLIDGQRVFDLSTLDSPATSKLQILGKNPSRQQVFDYIDSFGKSSLWPDGTVYDYSRVLKQIAIRETQGPFQFQTSEPFRGYPIWNRDGNGGVGIMQLNNNPAVNAYVWDWTANVREGIEYFNLKLIRATTYAKETFDSTEFQRALFDLNSWQTQNSLPNLFLSVPTLNAKQRIFFAIRAFDGVDFPDSIPLQKDSIGRFFRNEFELRLNSDGVLDVIQQTTRTGNLIWSRVPWEQRTAGNPNYVNEVLVQRP